MQLWEQGKIDLEEDISIVRQVLRYGRSLHAQWLEDMLMDIGREVLSGDSLDDIARQTGREVSDLKDNLKVYKKRMEAMSYSADGQTSKGTAYLYSALYPMGNAASCQTL